MLKILFKGLFAALAVKLLDRYRRLSLQIVCIEAAKAYVHGVRMARLSAIGMMRMGLMIGLIGVGVLLLHAGLFMLLPWSVETKAILGMSLGFIYTVIGAIALCAAIDERRWMRKSGAAALLRKATGQSGKD